MATQAGPGLRRASLRRQIGLLEHVRETMAREDSDDYERWAEALTPLTDELLHELMELEGVAPYPHPMGTWEGLFSTDEPTENQPTEWSPA